MLRLIATRLGTAIPTLLAATVIVFSVMRILPGDVALLIVGDTQNISEIERVREELGLNQSLIRQYLSWLQDVATLDLGSSLVTGQPVLDAIAPRLGVTALFVSVSVFLATLIAVPLGMYAAAHHNSSIDRGIVTTSIVGMSLPSFWVGLMLILVFGVQLRWFPTVGYVSPLEDFAQSLRFLALPVATLVIAEVGGILRMMRASTLDQLGQEYVRSAKTKGLDTPVILRRHVFRNAFAPTLTLLGMIFGTLLGGAAVIETVFTLPGLGRLLVTSIFARDYPVVQAIMLLVASIFVLINLVVDMLYGFLDPRVRL